MSERRASDHISWLENFYSRFCDGDWEHSYGFDIGNLDNPGWTFTADLNDSILEDADFEEINIKRSDKDWLVCRKSGPKFVGFGGSKNLDELIAVFRDWADAHLPPERSPWK